MSGNFAFRGYTRRIACAVVEAMAPRWAEFDPDLTDELVDQIEQMVRGYPTFVQVAVLASLYGVEFGGPLTLIGGLSPTSKLDRDEAYRRLNRIADAPIPQVRMLVLLLKIMVSFSAYSRPEVEAFLGVRRRAWRQQRQAFREQLVQLDARRADPPVPAPLGGEPLVTAAEYLDFDAGERPLIEKAG